ncbi:tRNA-histidine guanylyltransferase 1-like [Phlyctochytrium planicorne]|nr:tRNA-histidine guanylyltransferase 1-like [Phlyctochytrium planicorne]
MAKSKYEYVKTFEQHTVCLPRTYIVVRVDGHAFHRFTHVHKFQKPNDERGLNLANEAAAHVVTEMQDILMAYGQSDEYSFVFNKRTTLYKRREAKILTTLVSLFTSAYVMKWSKHFPDKELEYTPSFDGRIVLYPDDETLKDYFRWRQADCHINNLYNTLFWALVLDKDNPRTEVEAQKILKDSNSASKNEMLFTRYQINYNNLPAMFRKGSTVTRKRQAEEVTVDAEGIEVKTSKSRLLTVVEHVDIFHDTFWSEVLL